MSKLQEEIREVKRQQGGDILKLKDKETVVVKLDLDANGDVVGRVIDREYQGKKSKAVMFQVTMINTGERKSLPLAISWADTLIEKVQRKKQPVVEITRYGIDAKDTRYDFQTIA